MSLLQLLRQRVIIERAYDRMTAGTPPVPQLTDYGHPIRDWVALEDPEPFDPDNPTWQMGSIQTLKATEVPLFSQAGARDIWARIFLQPDVDVVAADRIHLNTDTAAPYWEITGVIDAAGHGHHLQLDAKLVQ